MPFTLLTPGRSIFGKGALELSRDALIALGAKPLIVTGPTTVKRDAFSRLTAVLVGVPYAVFSEIPSEPDERMVAAGAAVYVKEGCDCIIAIGRRQCAGLRQGHRRKRCAAEQYLRARG